RYVELPRNGKVWSDLLATGATLAPPGQPRAQVDVLVGFSQPLLERGGTIEDPGDLADAFALRTIRTDGLFLAPFAAPGTSAHARSGRLQPDLPAYCHLSRDPQGLDVVWTLAGDVDPAQPEPSLP